MAVMPLATSPYLNQQPRSLAEVLATRKQETRTMMTQQQWDSMTPAQKDKARDLSGLSPQLTGLEGWRVEVETTYGETRRFYVSRSTDWRPCHIEVNNRRSMGGPAAETTYKSVKRLYRK